MRLYGNFVTKCSTVFPTEVKSNTRRCIVVTERTDYTEWHREYRGVECKGTVLQRVHSLQQGTLSEQDK